MLIDTTLAITDAFAVSWGKVVEEKSIKVMLSQERRAPPKMILVLELLTAVIRPKSERSYSTMFVVPVIG